MLKKCRREKNRPLKKTMVLILLSFNGYFSTEYAYLEQKHFF